LEDSKQFEKPLYGGLLDLVKAYDSVEHWAIAEALRRLRFPESFISLVIDAHTNATATICSSGATSQPFVLGRGVLQGDPLACLIFLIFIDPIISTIHTKYEGYHMFKCPTASNPNEFTTPHISVLAFADDLLLLTESNDEMNNMLKDCKQFFDLVGSALSSSKTIMISTVENPGACFYGDTPLSFIDRNKPFRYLGIHFTTSLSWTHQIDRLKKAARHVRKLLTRKRIPPNQTTFVINAHLMALLLFGLGVGCASKKTIQQLQQICNSAARGSCGLPKSIITEAIKAPITEGGLGIYDLQSRVDAKILHDVSIRLASTTIGTLSARSRLHALQHLWGTVSNPLESPPGIIFYTDHQATKNHFMSLVRQTMQCYNRHLKITWPPRSYTRGPVLRSIIPIREYEIIRQKEPRLHDKLYLGDICNTNRSDLIPFNQWHRHMNWDQKRYNSKPPKWYRTLQTYICDPTSSNPHSILPHLKVRIPQSSGPTKQILPHSTKAPSTA